MLGVSRPVAADTTGTITSELSTSLLIHALFLLVFVFQTNFCTPRGAGRVTAAVKPFGAPGLESGFG
jgi:hypothetical protein